MRPVPIGVLTALVFFFSWGRTTAAESTTPQETLRAIERAYEAGDLGALRNQLTDDFEFLTQQGVEFSLDEHLKLMGPLFQRSRCELAFSEKDLKCLTVNPQTWAIPDMETRLSVTSGESTNEVMNLVTLYLIQGEESGAVRIFRWIEEPTSLESCK